MKCITFFLFFFTSISFGFQGNHNLKTFNDPSWTQSLGLSGFEVSGLWAEGNTVIAGAYTSQFANAVLIFLSTDNGLTWRGVDTIVVNNATFHPFVLISYPYVTFFSDSGDIFLGIGDCITGNVFVSTDQGLSWNERDTSFTQNVNCFTAMGESIFAGTNDGVYRSTDEGKTWSATNAGIGYQVEGITRLGPYLFAATTGEGIFRSSDCGISWSEADSGLVSTMISDSVKVIDISSIVTVEKYLLLGLQKADVMYLSIVASFGLEIQDLLIIQSIIFLQTTHIFL